MDFYVDHYAVLGLAPGEEGAEFTEKDIAKAYRLKAKELHPDKRPGDPNAHENFIKLSDSYDVLRDEKTRKLFDALLSTRKKRKEEEIQRQSCKDSKRQKMNSDPEESARRFAAAAKAKAKQSQRDEDAAAKKSDRWESAQCFGSFAAAAAAEARAKAKLYKDAAAARARAKAKAKPKAKQSQRDEDERTARKFKEAVDAIKGKFGYACPMHNVTRPSSTDGSDDIFEPSDKRKVLKVSWEPVGQGYNAQKLRKYFGSFGVVEEVIIPDKKKNSAML